MLSEKELTPDLLPNHLTQSIAAEIGVDNLMKLLLVVGGRTVYLPRQERVFRLLRDKKICEEWNGQNERELAEKYDLNLSWIRAIVRNTGQEK